MSNPYFQFKQFTIRQDGCAMKVGTDGVLLGCAAPVEKCSKVLDIGTGTGLIALMLAQRSQAGVDAVEIDENAFRCACGNAEQSPWPGRIQIYHDSFQHFANNNSGPGYDLIVTNPPYFNNSLKSPDQGKNLARHNDALPIGDLLKGVVQLLNPGGKFAIILPYLEAQLFIVDAALHHLYCNRKINIMPSAHKPCNRVIMQFSAQRSTPEEENLTILGENREYTSDYKTFTRDFYLAF